MTERSPLNPAATLSKPPPRPAAPAKAPDRLPPATLEDPVAPAPAPAPPVPPAAKPAKPAAKAAPASARSTGGLRSTSISIPPQLSEWVADTARMRGVTAAQVILEAVEAANDQLDDLVRAEQGPAASSSSLFPLPASSQRPASSEPRIIRDLTTPQANLDVLDQLTSKAGAASRSQLITAALRAAAAK